MGWETIIPAAVGLFGATQGGGDTTVTNTDPATQARYDDLYNKANLVANQPFVPYTGARVAGFNPDQLAGMDATRGLFNQSQQFNPQRGLQNLFNKSQRAPVARPFTGTATQLQPAAMQQAANIAPVDLYSGASINRSDVRDVRPQSLLDTNLSAYQNPFQSQVIDNTLGDLNRARQLQIQSDQDAAIGRGAFGGSRSAILEAETNRNFAEEAGKLSSNLRSQGFDRATSLAGQDIDRQFTGDRFMSDIDRQIAMTNAGYGNQFGLANLDAQNRAAFMRPDLEMQNRRFRAGLLGDQISDQYRGLGLLSGIGSQQQQLQQRGMDAGYNEFLRAIGYGPQQLGLLAQGVSALPTQTSTTNSNRGSSIADIGTAAGGIGQLISAWPSDSRLKENIKLIGQSKGHNVYTWDWNSKGKSIGASKFPTTGVIAQEVAHIPNAVTVGDHGYLMVNYGEL